MNYIRIANTVIIFITNDTEQAANVKLRVKGNTEIHFMFWVKEQIGLIGAPKELENTILQKWVTVNMNHPGKLLVKELMI